MRLSLYAALISIFIVATSCTQADQAETSPEVLSSESMLQHTVYFYLNPDVTEEQLMEFESGLSELMQIESIYAYELGEPAATEDREVTDHAFAYSIFSWFQTMDDYEIYADHPVHLDFIDRYSGLWADVKVYDSEIYEAKQ
jgi:hypothetical protein